MSSSTSPAASGMKRKLSVGAEEGRSSAPPIPPTSLAVPGAQPQLAPVNYLTKAKSDRLPLIQGDSETFADVLEMIDEYEGVLGRHESLAANLGAKLVGPLLVKSLDKLFEGPIKVTEPSYAINISPVTWMDIVSHSRTHPGDFVLTEQGLGGPAARVCRILVKDGQVEITEDDYRLLTSGAPERMIPIAPIADDELAELGTLEILQARLVMLIKKADAVAGKARKLNYHLQGRKNSMMSGKGDENSENAQASSSHPFAAVNRSSQTPSTEADRIKSQLLDHYLGFDRRTSLTSLQPKGSQIRSDSESRRASQTPNATMGDPFRTTMLAKIEKMEPGEKILPPCDRCRRRGTDCIKNLTACAGCTKKHAKCGWTLVKDEELLGHPIATSGSLVMNESPAQPSENLVPNGPIIMNDTPAPRFRAAPRGRLGPENGFTPQDQLSTDNAFVQQDQLSTESGFTPQVQSSSENGMIPQLSRENHSTPQNQLKIENDIPVQDSANTDERRSFSSPLFVSQAAHTRERRDERKAPSPVPSYSSNDLFASRPPAYPRKE